MITYDNIEYYDVNYINTINPAYFRGCSGKLRKIVSIKKIPEEYYIYAYHNKDGLVISDESYFKAHLFLDREWVDENIPGMKDNTGKPVVDILPDLIELDDHEQFIGQNGEKLKITIRGNRKKREFFFRVKDIVEEFDMPRLHDIISDKSSEGYLEHVHYKYFYRKKLSYSSETSDNQKIGHKRHLYLTYFGLMRSITSSKSKSVIMNQCAIINWFNNIVFRLGEVQELHLIKHINANTKGYVYIIDSPLITRTVKLGYWRASLRGLYSRYVTFYGDTLEITYFVYDNVLLTECNVLGHFSKYNVSGELFKKTHKKKYIKYLTTECLECGIYDIDDYRKK